jgi:CRP/FNR family transcriptional regulator, anaerobic regulatory protein
MITINTSARPNPPRRGAPIDSPAARTSDAIAQCATACSDCKLRGLCAPCCGLTRAEMDVADRLVFERLHVRRGESLCRNGERFTSLYAVRSGFFKSTALRENACDQVLRFSMTGDVLGIDGIGPERHICDTVALEDSDVCAIPFAQLQGLAHEIPGLQRQLHKTMSREIVREHGQMLLLGSMNAKERLATFLLDMSRRLAARGYSPSEFNLRMTREDIGSYLGQKLETVSRTFSKLQQEGLISVEQKFVRILDNAGLERVMSRDPN